MHLREVIHQKPSERVELFLRRHPITFIPKILFSLLLLAVPFALLPILFEIRLSTPFWGPVLLLLGSLYVLIVLALSLTQFVDYYLDIWIVTNNRIIDINQAGLFKRTVAELDLKKIQDAGSEIQGVFATFFNYGDVEIQTAGIEQKFKFLQIPQPNKVRTTVLTLVERQRRE